MSLSSGGQAGAGRAESSARGIEDFDGSKIGDSAVAVATRAADNGDLSVHERGGRMRITGNSKIWSGAAGSCGRIKDVAGSQRTGSVESSYQQDAAILQ